MPTSSRTESKGWFSLAGLRPAAVAPVSAPPWLLLVVFAGTWFYRLLSTTALLNDHFMHLAWANQLLGGELPVRDFVDPGMPLTYVASAVAQVLLGRGVWAEVVLSVTILALGAALTCQLATRASGSRAIGLLAAIIQVVIAPRLYSAPKLILHLWAIWAFWKFADKPTARTLAGLVACTAVAFLVRHDHGLYIWLAATLLLVSVHWPLGVRRAAGYSVLVAVALLPYALYVQLSGGIVSYLRAGVGFTRAEYSGRIVEVRPQFDLSPRARQMPEINVRWAAAVDDATRTRVELEHRLEQPKHLTDRTWRYRLRDLSRSNVRVLIHRPEVEDTGGIDRGHAQVIGLDDTILGRIGAWASDRGAGWLTGLAKRQNAVAWTYLLFTSIPYIALLVVAISRFNSSLRLDTGPIPPLIIAAALLGIVTNAGFLRDQLDVRLADAAAVPLVLAAWLAGLVWHAASARSHTSKPHPTVWARTAAQGVATAAIFLLGGTTFLTAAELGSFLRVVDESQVERGPRSVARGALQTFRVLRAQPPIDGWLAAGNEQRELKQLTQYVRDCTTPDDRVLVAWFAPEVYFFAERRFAAGLAFFYPGFFSSPAEEEIALSRLRSERVPIVLAEGSGRELVNHPLLAEELVHEYVQALEVPASDGRRYRVLVDRRVTPVRTATQWNLPCFR